MKPQRFHSLRLPLGILDSISTGVVVSILTFLGAAYFTSSLPLLIICGFLALTLTTGWLSVRLGRRLPHLKWHRTLPWWVTGSTLLVVIPIAALTVFRPTDLAPVPPPAASTIQYWTLPTGSRLASVFSPAQGASRPFPVILLHGGPGAPGALSVSPLQHTLAQAGFDVYRYDQIGAGQSDRLNDPSLYTVERHVADLEAIRQRLRTERMILIGGSWGATLAAHYMAAHPQRVERAVMSGPGAIWAPAFRRLGGASQGPERTLIWQHSTPRFLVASALLRINPRAAQNFASDQEMSHFFAPIIGQLSHSDVKTCIAPGQPAPIPETGQVPAGFGFYVNMVTSADMNRVADPRPTLRQNQTPVLVLRGECDRLRPEVARDYREVFPQATLLNIQGAGHAIEGSKPEVSSRVIKAFLLGQPLPQSADTGDETPR